MAPVNKLLNAITFFLTIFALTAGQFDDDTTTAPLQDCNSTVISEQDIFDIVFADYSRETRPTQNYLEPIVVTISLHLYRLTAFVEIDHTLILNGYIHLEWKDVSLEWQSKFPYSCVESIMVRPEKIWLPDVIILNDADVPTIDPLLHSSVRQGLRARVASDGVAMFDPSGLMAVTCGLDLTFFPFDEQICEVVIESSNNDVTQQIYQLSADFPFTKTDGQWIENQRWHVVRNWSKVEQTRYHQYNVYFSKAVFTLVLHRKSQFYWVSIIIPSLVIAIIETVTFAMALDDVNKFCFTVMCLLAYSFFQSLISYDLPRSSDRVPLLSLYICLQMIYIALFPLLIEAVVFVLISYARCKNEKSPPENLLKTAEAFGRVVFVKQRECFFVNNDRKTPEQRMREKIMVKWLFIAQVLERINMIGYLLAVTLTPLLLFEIGLAKQKETLSNL